MEWRQIERKHTQGKFYCASAIRKSKSKDYEVFSGEEVSGCLVEVRDLLLVSKFYGQATKGTRWMPWHFEAMKDVASCDKLR